MPYLVFQMSKGMCFPAAEKKPQNGNKYHQKKFLIINITNNAFNEKIINSTNPFHQKSNTAKETST